MNTAADAGIDVGVTLPMSASASQELNIPAISATAEWAERAGFDTVWASDHIFHPVQIIDSLTTLAFVAARTRRIKLATGVFQLPLRQLGVAAKQVAALALLSEGRFLFGVGVGGEWPDEWTAVGVPSHERGARMEEALPILRHLLAGETVDFKGRFHTFPSVALTPRPPPVPVYFAGRARPALERAARHGDGWLGFLLTVEGFRRDRAVIAEARAQAKLEAPYVYGIQVMFRFDRDNDGAALRAAEAHNSIFPPEMVLTPPDKLARFLVAGTPERVLEQLRAYADAGCRMFSLSPIVGQPDTQEQMDILAAEVLPKLKTW